jgi:hypothetical protein
MRSSHFVLFFALLVACGWSTHLLAATGQASPGIDTGAFYMTLTSVPEVVEAGQQVEITVQLTDAYGAPVSGFEVVRGKKLHLTIVREGLDKFTHTFPEPGPQGTMVTGMTFPEGGTYLFHADFTPMDGSPVTLVAELRVEGGGSAAPPLDPYVPGMVQTSEMLANVGVEPGLVTHRVSFALMDLNEEPVTDLENFLGARGHFIALSADGRQYVHGEPAAGNTANEVAFEVHFPGPGIYKGWGEFQRAGTVLVVPVVMQID